MISVNDFPAQGNGIVSGASGSRQHRTARAFHKLLPVLLPVSIYFLHGCTSVPDNYPGQWPDRLYTSAQDCPDITGTYSNPGDGSAREYLFDSITNEGIFGIHECTDCKVIVEWMDPGQDQLSVTLQDATGAVLEDALLNKDKGDFTCQEGAISIKYLVAAEFVLVGGIRSGTRKYYLSEDGSLIAEDAFTSAGHVYVYVPAARKSTAYTRWLRVDDAGKKQAADYEARTLVLAGKLQDIPEAATKGNLAPAPLPGSTAGVWWEIFRLSVSRGEPDFGALCRAADQGDSRARRELGYLYYHGLHGVRKDPVLSAFWYGLVESYSQDPDSFSTGREQLTPEQLGELKDRYINWKPGHCERELYGTGPGNTS